MSISRVLPFLPLLACDATTDSDSAGRAASPLDRRMDRADAPTEVVAGASVTIAGGATGTKSAAVTLTLAATDATEMCLSNTTSCTAWTTFATSASWSLTSGKGTKTVYAWFRDGAGTLSDVVSDTIVVDTTKPTNGTASASGADGAATVSWTGFSDSGAGISSFTLVQASGSSAPSSSCTGTPIWTGADTSVAVSGLTNGSTYSWRVCATDGAGNISSGATTSVVPAPEYTPPTGTISINAGATYSTSKSVTVTLAATDDSGVAYACLSNSSACSTWFAMADTKSWTLTGTGTKTVYGWFKDVYGNVSATTIDSIVVDSGAPSNGTVTSTASDATIVLSWSGYSDTNGIAGYKIAYGASTPATSCTTGTEGYAGPTTTLTGLTNGTTYTVRVCAIDSAGNVSTGATTSALVAPEYNPPTGTIQLNSGKTWVNSSTVGVGATATDDTGVAQMCFSTSSTKACTAWQAYSTGASATLAGGTGTQTLYGWFKDTWGTTSAVTSDSIMVDRIKPVDGTVTTTRLSCGGANVSWSGFSDADSGISRYLGVYQTGSSPRTGCSGGTPFASGTTTVGAFSCIPEGTKVYVRVCALDSAGNYSDGATTSYTAL